MITTLMPLVLIFVIFYFLLIMPQRRKQKEHQQMVRNLKKGDKIVTTGGVYGTIIGLKK
ncbi:preprotein translocase subunit YajC, partial [Candidatus Aerophobetes bacterium]|nr:preprotein translocase subunit YajC [Candidatus Aerophobetes bacterium]